MIEFTDAERAWHVDMRGLTRDEHGNEVLVGLTVEETEFYVNHSRKFASGRRDRDPINKAKYLELNAKHERARIAVVANEAYMRTENPTRQ